MMGAAVFIDAKTARGGAGRFRKGFTLIELLVRIQYRCPMSAP
jgi:hypothetical protein